MLDYNRNTDTIGVSVDTTDNNYTFTITRINNNYSTMFYIDLSNNGVLPHPIHYLPLHLVIII